jgi:hypothetical protein
MKLLKNLPNPATKPKQKIDGNATTPTITKQRYEIENMKTRV